MSEIVYNMYMGIVDWIYPRLCAGCGAEGEYLCPSCAVALHTPPAICPVCCTPSNQGWTHARCTSPYGIDRLLVGLPYHGPVQKLLKHVKYKSSWDIISSLATLSIRHFTIEGLPEDTVVTSVPMHIWKERERGFNQAAIFGSLLSEYLILPYADVLVRIRETTPMFGLTKKERGINVRGAFTIRDDGADVGGRTLLLVDDVWTTGATLRECTKVLKRRGAASVWALSLAR